MAELGDHHYPIKLVRDFVPDMVNNRGDVYFGPLPEDEDPEKWLIKKLVEEVAEFVADPTDKELLDIYAVVDAFASRRRLDLDRMHRDDPRGGFHDMVVMYVT